MSPARSKTAVHWMSEGECLVRGTTDPVKALGLAMEETSNGGWNWEDDLGAPHQDEPDPDIDRIHARDAAAFCFTRLDPRSHRAGHFRMNVQAPGGDYTWVLGYEDGPGRGNFAGVLFDH